MERKPHVLISYAQSLDGRIATSTGDSRWISGNETLTLAHELRRDHDSILVGIGTVIRDDPELSCRLPGAASPVRIILDGSLRLPLNSRIVQTAGSLRTLVFCTRHASRSRKAALESRRIEVLTCDSAHAETTIDADPVVDLHRMLATVSNIGIRSVFVEGGSAVITSFLYERLVDRMVVVIAPVIIGAGTDAVGELNTRVMADALRLEPTTPRTLGRDLVWDLKL